MYTSTDGTCTSRAGPVVEADGAMARRGKRRKPSSHPPLWVVVVVVAAIAVLASLVLTAGNKDEASVPTGTAGSDVVPPRAKGRTSISLGIVNGDACITMRECLH